MEAILIDCVQNSLRHFMYKNAIFICERLCVEFPTEVNMQLLARCFLCNNQAYAAYYILQGTQTAQSRCLFALSCFQMDLLDEAEKALSPGHDSSSEVPNGATGHYLLGLVYRYTDRQKSAVHHFKQALSMDPLFWAAYEELCILGYAEEAGAVFGESAVHIIQKQQQQQHVFSSQKFVTGSEDHSQGSSSIMEDSSLRQLKNNNSNSVKEASGGYHGALASSIAVNQPLNYAASSLSFYNTPSPMASQAMAGESAVHIIQKQQQQQHVFSSPKFVTGSEDHSQVSSSIMEDSSLRQLKNINSNSVKEASGGYHGALASSIAVNQPLNYAASSLSYYNTPSPMASQAMAGESAVHIIQKQQQQQHVFSSPKFVTGSEDHSQGSSSIMEDSSLRQLKNSNSVKEASGGYHGALASSIAVNQPLNYAASSLSYYNTPSPMASQAMAGESAVHIIQKQQQQQHVFSSLKFVTGSEDHSQGSSSIMEDSSLRQLKNRNSNSVKEASGGYHGALASSIAVNQPLNYAASSLSYYNTPSPMASQLSGIAPPPPVRKNVQQFAGPGSSESSPRSTVNANMESPRRMFVDEGKFPKISGRLFSDSMPRRSTQIAGEAGGTTISTSIASTGNGTTHSTKHMGSSRLSNAGFRSVTIRKGQAWASVRPETFDDARFNTQASSTSTASCDDGGFASSSRFSDDDSKIQNGASEILVLWRLLGEGYKLSCMYKCQDALNTYQKLPSRHYNTSWVLSQVGKAYFEVGDYLEADRAFSLARRLCPYSLDGMDVYSTVLYHLKEDMKLSYLAQELLSTDRLAPQTWCAIGNCYSLQKDHDTALENFQRAVQLNSRFAYAHTLCGQEHVALEDFESGIRSFQSALSVDSRHYNSWYGLGMVYLRQEKIEFAEHHFQIAFQINPRSSVIMSYLGTALHALKRNEEALMMMEKAIVADKKNPHPMYQKAIILCSMDKYDEALEVLEELKEYAPCQCSIYVLMGKIYMQRNVYGKAMLHFGIAWDLKPSASDVATIKAAIEKLHRQLG